MPLITSLVAGGDDVAVAAAGDAAGFVAGSGAEFRPVGHGEGEWFSTLVGRTRGAPGDGLAPERIHHYFLPRVFAEIAADDMIDDLVVVGEAFDPDVILFESCAFAAPLLGDLLEVPVVHHLFGPKIETEVMELIDDAVSPLWRSFGRKSPGLAGVYRDLTIEICPPSLEVDQTTYGERLFLRPAPPPIEDRSVPERPLVYATLGTVMNTATDIFRDILIGLSDEPLDVVVTVGRDRDPAELDPIPANARVERFIPQAALLPRCAVVVHHGGAGTTFGCLTHGVPQVVIPQGADNFINASMVERVGAGLTLMPGHVNPQSIRDAVSATIHDPRFDSGARRVADEIALMPGPDGVAQQLRTWIGERQSRTASKE
ncbi:MAG: nucleotide disphospho-sugar-binding domain-containing protein [Acidimicrobiales bacterium]